MTDNFDWRTEDDSSWDSEESQKTETAVPRQRPWRALALIAGLLLLAAIAIYWQFTQRIETLTAAIEVDVLSTHNLVNRAVSQQDLELLAPLLSVRDLAWTNTQEQLFQNGLFYDRTQMGLPLAHVETDAPELVPNSPRYVAITVAPDMNTAELRFLQAHLAGDETVMLEQTAIYRRGRTRWLFSPPDDAFWGEWQTNEMEHLTLVYPARDTAVAQKLATDLPNILETACRQLSDCPEDWQVSLRLETNPDSLLAAADPANLYNNNLRVSLPAPTIIGRPVDEAGYQALLHAYAAPLVAALITQQTGWECCHHAPFYQAFMDYQLHQLGLRPWPVTSETHARIVNSNPNLDRLLPFFQADSFDRLTGEDGWQLYAFADFLMRQHPAIDPPAALAALQETQTLQQWLAVLFERDREEGVIIQDHLSRDWWLYAHNQMVNTQGPRPLPFPAQDIQLTCTAESIEAAGTVEVADTTLYRYHLDSEEWQAESSVAGFMYVNPLPGDEAVILQTISLVDENYRSSIWQNGEGVPATDEAYAIALSLGQVDPLGQYLVAYVIEEADTENSLQVMLVDLSTCEMGTCMQTPFNGLPVWSPDGSQMVLALTYPLENGLLPTADGRVLVFDTGDASSLRNFPLFRADASGGAESQVAVGGAESQGGNLPFWVDNQTYGYVVSENFSGRETIQTVMLAAVEDDVPYPILTTDDLAAVLPEASRPLRFSIRFVVAHPTDPNLLVVGASSRETSYLYLVDLENDQIENRLQFHSAAMQFFGFSPDGRYFVISGAPDVDSLAPEETTAYFLHDLAQNETQTFLTSSSTYFPAYTFDWSADGRWLALIMNNGAINLIAPGTGYQHLLLHDAGDCSSIAWVNPIPKQP